MNKNIIDTYSTVIELKNVIRTGWKEVGVSPNKIESIMDHIGGSVFLAMIISTEKNYTLDMTKVYEMIAINEIKKLETNSEYSIGNTTQYSEDFVMSLLGKLSNSSRLINIYKEFKNGETEEAKFVGMILKLESDFQAKKYELDGEFTLENAKKDIENYPEELKSQLTDIKKASDGWLTYDKQYYNNEFKEISEELGEQ